MYRQTEDQVQWGQGLPQAQQPPRGGQQWQQSPMHGGQQTPQYYQQNAPGQQYGPPASQGGEQWQGAAWSGQPQGTPYQQGSPAYGAGPPAGQGESAWRGGAQPQQGGQGWQSATQGQHPGQAAPQQQQQAASPMENVRVGTQNLGAYCPGMGARPCTEALRLQIKACSLRRKASAASAALATAGEAVPTH
ncbi:hypothetical protein CVIRNUC_004811 [Coccomyxa viridis]|uniref:Uncharacterized protein n=1 Tax=Coccomyxa viridis TaxID=1274662 RepID=A0AAV1I2P4_9CHLO|nr:hypothetical protein CVIRNUC_004811 [Coccomyxa viridis]